MPEVVFHHVGIYSRTPRWLRFATILLPSSQTLVSRLQKVSGVEYLGEWNEVGPLYQAADIALVPPRGGGSTKLKLLETVA